MSRPLRLQAHDASYHVWSHAVDERWIFATDEEKEVFLAILGATTARCDLVCHFYCVMDNHFHLVLQTPMGNLAPAMQRLCAAYAQYYNRSHARRGHVFDSRYGSELILDEAQFLQAVRYLALNPVEAGTCHAPAQWRWSSYPALIGLAREQPWLVLSEIRALLGEAPAERARALVEGTGVARGRSAPSEGVNRR